MSNLQLEPNRIIEISRLGRFYVMGRPKFIHLYIPDPLNTNRDGWIIVQEKDGIYTGSTIHSLNCLFKIPRRGNLIPALFKKEEMAEEVCFACNRIRI